MDRKTPEFQALRRYWNLSEKLLANASKDDIAEAARILALQLAYFIREYDAVPNLELVRLLTTNDLDAREIALLHDGTVALVGVLGAITNDLQQSTQDPVM